MDNRPIGIFDSGLGGITVLNELKKTLPQENYIYLGDTLNFPYGSKTKEQIIEFSEKNAQYLKSQNVKMIVIACGTATSQALDEIKSKYNIYIEGIIEPTVDYVKNEKITKIGVIGTEGTIKSGAWEKYLKLKIPNIEVINQACPILAEIVEENKAKTKEAQDAIHNYMKIFKENNVKNLILGCTHYSIIEELIKKEFDYNVNLINTGNTIASKIKQELTKRKMLNKANQNNIKIVVSKYEKGFEKSIKNLLKSAKTLDITYFN